MMKTIILEKEKVYCGTVLLVNAGHPIMASSEGQPRIMALLSVMQRIRKT